MKDKLYSLWAHPKRPIVVVGFISFNAGVGLAYFLLKRKINTYSVIEEVTSGEVNVIDIDDEPVKSSRKKFTVVNDPKDLNQIFSNTITTEAKRPKIDVNAEEFVQKVIQDEIEDEKDEKDDELIRRSVFVQSDNWDYALEVSKRTSNAPYIIHRDEFFNNEKGYTQSTLTFYAGDDILCSPDDTPMYSHEQFTGPLLFGHGSGDSNVVYIRNDKRKEEYEIVLNLEMYSKEVLGLDAEDRGRNQDLRHSRVQKFRDE